MAVHVGDCGEAATGLRPHGFVWVNGERYDARSEFGAIEPGGEVVIVAGDHLGLVVRELRPGAPANLPDHGRPICASFEDRVLEEAERAEAEREKWIDEHQHSGFTVASVAGALVAVVTLWLLWGYINDQTEDPWSAAAAVFAGGVLWGLAVFQVLDDTLGQVGNNFRRVATPSACLALLGTGGGAVLSIPTLGLGSGLIIALFSASILAVVLPLFLLLSGADPG